ncbi:MAG: hypothetical protein ACRDRS_25100 [Pseudonocardiaceae bacterium]
MTSNHADFYLGTGPDAVWLGSVADLGGPAEMAVEPIGLTARGVDLLTATHPALYRERVTRLLADTREAGHALTATPAQGWPWRPASSAGWYAYTFAVGRVRVSYRGGPWFVPDPHRADGGVEAAAGPDAELPIMRTDQPRTVTARVPFRGMPVPVSATLPPVSDTYLAQRVDAALVIADAVTIVTGRRVPLADLTTAPIRSVMLSLMHPGPGSDLWVLPKDTPRTHERVATAIQKLLTADRYAQGNNPGYAATLLAQAATVAGQAVSTHPLVPSINERV